MPLFGGRTRGKGTRIFYASDVHGSERTWRKFLNAGKFYGADVLVMGGDVMGKLAIPIIREGPDRHRATVLGRVEHFEGTAALAAMREQIANLGFYPTELDEDEYRAVQGDDAAIERLFVELANERLERWISLAHDRLAGSGVRCYATGGNDDLTEVMARMETMASESFVPCENGVVPLDDDHLMVSLPYVNPTPWRTPREAPEEDLARMIAERVAGMGEFGHVIFNFHAPPRDSTLDTCPMLDTSTDPPRQVSVAGQPVLHGAGSSAVREALERHQPLLGLHGHIHESPAIARIGRTLVLNPGSEYGEGVLRGALITIARGRVESYQLTTG